MTQTAKKKRQVIARVGQNGELHILGDVVPFVSSRLGPEGVSHETEQERDAEARIVRDGVCWRDSVA